MDSEDLSEKTFHCQTVCPSLLLGTVEGGTDVCLTRVNIKTLNLYYKSFDSPFPRSLTPSALSSFDITC